MSRLFPLPELVIVAAWRQSSCRTPCVDSENQAAWRPLWFVSAKSASDDGYWAQTQIVEFALGAIRTSSADRS